VLLALIFFAIVLTMTFYVTLKSNNNLTGYELLKDRLPVTHTVFAL